MAKLSFPLLLLVSLSLLAAHVDAQMQNQVVKRADCDVVVSGALALVDSNSGSQLAYVIVDGDGDLIEADGPDTFTFTACGQLTNASGQCVTALEAVTSRFIVADCSGDGSQAFAMDGTTIGLADGRTAVASVSWGADYAIQPAPGGSSSTVLTLS